MRLRFGLFVLASPLIFTALVLYMIASMLALPIMLLACRFEVGPW